MWVIVVGNIVDGVTLYGPFATRDEAIRWANCNPVTDLSGRAWAAAPVEKITEEDASDVRWAIYDTDDESLLTRVYDDYEECVADANQLNNSLIVAIHV